jgi:hypothetical protein
MSSTITAMVDGSSAHRGIDALEDGGHGGNRREVR